MSTQTHSNTTPPLSPKKTAHDRANRANRTALTDGRVKDTPQDQEHHEHPTTNQHQDTFTDNLAVAFDVDANANLNSNSNTNASQSIFKPRSIETNIDGPLPRVHNIHVVSPTNTPPRLSAQNRQTQDMHVIHPNNDTISGANLTLGSGTSRNRKIHPFSNLSPRVPHSYIIHRTQSSPCVLDSSPKVSQGMGRQAQISQLTPVTRNTNKFIYDPNVSQILCVPEEHSFTKKSASGNGANSSNTTQLLPSNNQMIQPRSISCVINSHQFYDFDDNISEDVEAHSLRPISPPARTSLRPAATTDTNSMVSNTELSSKRFESPQDRFSSPLDSRVKLDRNHHSVPIISNTTTTLRGTSATSSSSQQSSPETTVGTPEPRSPETSLFVPYQPTRDSSLASFGVVPDDLDEIFLPLRTTNKFRRSSKDKVVLVNGGRGGSGGFGIGIHHSSIHDDEDANTHISDSQSSTSIPSIRLGARIRSSTQDSYTTFEGIDDDEVEDPNYSISTFEEEDEGAYSHEDDYGMQFKSHEINGVTSSTMKNKRKKNQQGRFLSSSKEKQVYEWLRTLEVDRDNNEYVAEAASSKFLTGKMHNDEYILDTDGARLFVPEKTRVAAEQVVSSRNERGEMNVQPTIIEISDSVELKSGNSKDSTASGNSKDSTASSSPLRGTSTNKSTNKIVMGRNVCAFGTRSSKTGGKAKSSSFKVSGLYR